MNHVLALWEYASWGAFGGVAVEAIEILGAVKRTKGLPWNQPGEATLGALLFTVLVRLGLGAGLAVALGEAGQISGGVGAIAAGVAAPLILEQMGRQLQTEAKVKYQYSIDSEPKGHIGDNQIYRWDDSPSPTPEPSPPLNPSPHPTPEPSGRSRPSPTTPPSWYSAGPPQTVPSPSLRRRKGQDRLIRLAREVAFGVTRSTPAFGGTAEL